MVLWNMRKSSVDMPEPAEKASGLKRGFPTRWTLQGTILLCDVGGGLRE